MARVCSVTGKRPVKGRRIIHKGQSKKSGGIGLQLVKQTKRTFKPNVQRIRVRMANGAVKREWVSVKAHNRISRNLIARETLSESSSEHSPSGIFLSGNTTAAFILGVASAETRLSSRGFGHFLHCPCGHSSERRILSLFAYFSESAAGFCR